MLEMTAFAQIRYVDGKGGKIKSRICIEGLPKKFPLLCKVNKVWMKTKTTNKEKPKQLAIIKTLTEQF